VALLHNMTRRKATLQKRKKYHKECIGTNEPFENNIFEEYISIERDDEALKVEFKKGYYYVDGYRVV